MLGTQSGTANQPAHRQQTFPGEIKINQQLYACDLWPKIRSF